jgi:hypothetical protein
MRIYPLLTMSGTCFLAIIAGAQDAAPPEKTFEANVPIRAITEGSEAHWFAYYDKHQFDPGNRYVLGMRVGFEGRSPTPDDVIYLGMIDLEDGDRWIPLGESRAWGWQQGCMLQWVPGSTNEVLYNDREGETFFSVIKNVFTGESRRLPRPIYTLSPDGKTGVSINFARLDNTRPGYGYKGGRDPYADEIHPEKDGIFRVDLETGDTELIVSLAQIAAIPVEEPPAGKHWFNHLLFNTDGTRFIFLHRVHHSLEKTNSWTTRMFTAAPDGSDIHCVADHLMVSHFIWRNPKQILAWSREPETGNRFHLYDDQTDRVEVIGEGILTHDGHCSYSPCGNWIITDTYPDKERMQTLLLYRPADNHVEPLGRFYQYPEHRGEWRCDLHPRWSRDGRYVTIDSTHGDGKRQIYLLDVSGITMP